MQFVIGPVLVQRALRAEIDLNGAGQVGYLGDLAVVAQLEEPAASRGQPGLALLFVLGGQEVGRLLDGGRADQDAEVPSGR
ncbi:hypothetical protein [Streptomyces sp. NPDC007088]|uniref:hypothetical protein n=1 Tax=Streptomyces sp. NPDC007088 TaxID=3364773 RepID=UPI0036CB987B